MEMEVGEIRRQYKHAKDRKKCISILAELNDCSKDDIKMILGLDGNQVGKPAEDQKFNLSDNEIKSLYNRLDELDAEIKPLEDEYKRTVQMILSAESIKLPAVVQEKERRWERMRLIDADKIEIDEECTFSGKGIKAFLDAIPTAYDVDKVVDQLKRNSYPYMGDEDDRDIDLNDAVKIVKSGGMQ